MSGLAFAPKEPNKDWAKLHRANWLAGRSLLMIQVEMASDALREVWAEEDGQRVCRERLGAAA